MTERTRKVASLVKQVVAAEMRQLPESGRYTVTRVEVTPDLRQVTVWVGIIGAPSLFAEISNFQSDIQEAVARRLETKFTPKISFRHDEGGEHASRISRLIKGDSQSEKP